jgi:hypothetical protein
VLYEKGGSDFRVPNLKYTSSIGRQILSKPGYITAPKTSFPSTVRFPSSETITPGPNLPQTSSFKKQLNSKMKTASKVVMGTSSRESASKLYRRV